MLSVNCKSPQNYKMNIFLIFTQVDKQSVPIHTMFYFKNFI